MEQRLRAPNTAFWRRSGQLLAAAIGAGTLAMSCDQIAADRPRACAVNGITEVDTREQSLAEAKNTVPGLEFAPQCRETIEQMVARQNDNGHQTVYYLPDSVSSE